MNYGAVMFVTDYAIRPDDLARAREGRGFQSVWQRAPRAPARRGFAVAAQVG